MTNINRFETKNLFVVYKKQNHDTEIDNFIHNNLSKFKSCIHNDFYEFEDISSIKKSQYNQDVYEVYYPALKILFYTKNNNKPYQMIFMCVQNGCYDHIITIKKNNTKIISRIL